MGPRRRRFKSCRSDHFDESDLPEENEEKAVCGEPLAEGDPKLSPNNPPELAPEEADERGLSFPVKLKHRGKVLARIYKRPGSGYRLYWRVREADGRPKTRQREFTRYSAAKKAGDDLVSDLAKGSQVTALTPGQARDALAAISHLQSFFEETGKRFSLLDCAAGFSGAVRRLHDRPLGDAVDGFLSTTATVKRYDLLQAALDWIATREPKTVAKDGKRPQLSTGYHYNVSMWVKEFANTFPGYAVCDIAKEHIDRYMADHSDVGPKSRNERRNVVRMFLGWCVKKDYLISTHRLFEADGMAREVTEPAEIELYTADDLQAMLNRASRAPKRAKKGKQPEADYRALLPLVALVALGGVRLQEAARMTWQDVWRVEGYIEVPAGKSKTRSRRLATMSTTLSQWFESYRECKDALWPHCMDHFHREFEHMLAELEVNARRNGLRHGFVSAHYAAHTDEGLTAKEAGTSPAMVHKHYKGLMTKKQGEAWLGVAPVRPDNMIQLSIAAKKVLRDA